MAQREYQRTNVPGASSATPLSNSHPKPGLRRILDVLCAAAGLALLAPILAVIALAIKVEDGGPIFYFHIRVGQGLRTFRVRKFRSMFVASAGGSPLTSPADVRVTRVGRILRKYKLDELPQLLNVVNGEMRFVGVRPQVEKFVEMYHDEYAEMLRTPPGITGLASLWFRNEEQLYSSAAIEDEYVEKILPMKVAIALEYERSRTWVSDVEMLLRTALGFGCPRITLTAQILRLLCDGLPRAIDGTREMPR